MNTKLQALIRERPTLTVLKNASTKDEVEFDSLPKIKQFTKKLTIPDSFDGREVWKGLLSPVKNQGKCGSCWAFASTSTLSDRFNIQSGGQINIDLSPTKLILCDFMGREKDIKHPEQEGNLTSRLNTESLTTGSCRGNSLFDAWRYLFIYGTPTEDCVPYNKTILSEISTQPIGEFSQIDKLPFCTMVSGPIGDMCYDTKIDSWTGEELGTPSRLFRCLHIYSIAGTPQNDGSEYNIRFNIFEWGPVTTGMIVYPDFYTFNPKTEIYEWNGQGEPVGGHAIEIVGWGEENNTKYWIIKNSWGRDWGRNGYFYMKRGNNMCKIEENIISGIPDFFYPLNHPVYDPSEFTWSETKDITTHRFKVESDYTMTGGGIDPTTGYSRRNMIDKPWIDYKRPIDIENLPNWHKFVAGRDATIDNRKKFWKKNPIPFIYIVMTILIILLMFLIFYKFSRLKYK